MSIIRHLTMVKNTVGGSKHKTFARKQQEAPAPVISYVRRATQPGEYYASATKNHGGGRFGVLCSDGKERICIIRRKFKRQRSVNNISVGVYMLVGAREFATDDTLCDLLCVYNQNEVNLLKQDPSFKYEMLCVNEKKVEDMEKVKRQPGLSGREKAALEPKRYIEDIEFDEDKSESEEEVAEETEIAAQSKFINVTKQKSYDIDAYLEGIDEVSEEDDLSCREKDEWGNYC